MILRDFLPASAFNDHPALKQYARAQVLARHTGGWPGRHAFVFEWFEIPGNRAVGWNENPFRGWSFPIIKLSHRAKENQS